jgi:hypothetical protein
MIKQAYSESEDGQPVGSFTDPGHGKSNPNS